MPRARRSRVDVQIDLMPMIDVVFLLLTFFIFVLVLTAQFKVSWVALPSAGAAEDQAEGRLVVIALTAEGEVLIDDEPVALGAIAQRLGAIEEASGHPPRIVLAVDREADWGPHVELQDALQAAGVEGWGYLRENTGP